MINIVQYLEEEIKKLEQDLVECSTEREREITSFYDVSIDEDGVPYNMGNYNDVYDDGYSNGEQQGRLDALKIVLDHMTACKYM